MTDRNPYKPPSTDPLSRRSPGAGKRTLGESMSAPVFWFMYGGFWLLDLMLVGCVAMAVWTQRLPDCSWQGACEGEVALADAPGQFLLTAWILCALTFGYSTYLAALWQERPRKHR